MTSRKPHRKAAVPLPAAKHPDPTIALVDEKNAEIAELKRELTRRKLRATNTFVSEAAKLKASLAATAAGAERLAQANGIERPFAFTDVVDKTLARLEATQAWTKLATERLLAALAGQPIRHPTLGWVMTLIENLIEDRRLFGACVCGAAGLPNDAHKQTPFAVIESITQSTELIARLAHNLSEDDEQEKIAMATPAEQRARVEECVFELGLLSLLGEMRAKAKAASAADEMCLHVDTEPGKPVARQWGSWQTEVCRKCGEFRTHGSDPGQARIGGWRPASEYAEATAKAEDE